jgi:hypothetical protein
MPRIASQPPYHGAVKSRGADLPKAADAAPAQPAAVESGDTFVRTGGSPPLAVPAGARLREGSSDAAVAALVRGSTPSELLDELKSFSTAAPRNAVLAYCQLSLALKQLVPKNSAASPLVEMACLSALQAIDSLNLASGLLDALGLCHDDQPSAESEVLYFATRPDTPRPIDEKPLAFDPSAACKACGPNALLSSQMAAAIYDSAELALDAFRRQGFADATAVQNKVLPNGVALLEGGYAIVGNRAPSDESSGLTIVAFRGSANPGDALQDAKAVLVDAGPKYGAGKVHQGFDEQLETIWPPIATKIREARAEHPDRPVLFTGHSLGGAMAVLALARAQKEGLLSHPPFTGEPPAAILDSYGQPRVGDAEFADAFASANAGVPYHRYVYRADLVTEVPPLLLGYADISTAVAVHYDDARRTSVVGQPLPPLSTDPLDHLDHHDEMNYVNWLRRERNNPL